jgi:hypothetical protein
MSFPVDDLTLEALEEGLETGYLSRMLDFLSAYDASYHKMIEDPAFDWDEHPVFTYPEACYRHNDVISALVAEVKRLRGTN